LGVTIGVTQYVNRIEEKIIPYWTWPSGEVETAPHEVPGIPAFVIDFAGETQFADLTITGPHSLIVPCGEKGEIIIRFSTGQVELKDCPLPEAAREFWSAVYEAFPEFKQAICKEKGESK
jgi:hypothetical protein